MFAVLIGLSAGLIFEPGAGVDLSMIPNENSEKVAAASQSAPPSIVEFLVALIPTNPIYSMANDGFLQIIIFSQFFTGITINIVGERAKPVKEVIHSAAQVSFKMIEIIIRLAPIGVFGFIVGYWYARNRHSNCFRKIDYYCVNCLCVSICNIWCHVDDIC